MHCPLCGGKLTEVQKKDLEQEMIDKLMDEDAPMDDPRWSDLPEKDDSIWWKCTHCNSFGDDYPLQEHHPLRGMNSRPGDSWSLTWLK